MSINQPRHIRLTSHPEPLAHRWPIHWGAATPAARERFIVGTLASLVWACAVAAITPLALW